MRVADPMLEQTYPFGQTVRLSAEFDDGEECDATAIDPDAVTLKVKAPDATVTNYVYSVDVAVIRDELGAFHLDLAANQAGLWRYEWSGTGPFAALRQWKFMVDADLFA